jgi:hypothetical protein|tara:strand:+ start:594 stop:1235 length:642 start_codon:yes stop_codon:yes gene_type:complete
MKKLILLFLFCPHSVIQAQVFAFTVNGQNHRILMDDNYLIETVFMKINGAFVLSRGGYYTKTANGIDLAFEFNSNYERDSLTSISFTLNNPWNKISQADQELEGKWLMAGRVKAEGEQRQNFTGSRKTLKFLLDGYFQWTAFDTESMRFMGSGGGTYSAQNKEYIETLDYFSRDNKKVGKVLPFEFLLNENDWYHKGLNSKSKAMHEIWCRRI